MKQGRVLDVTQPQEIFQAAKIGILGAGNIAGTMAETLQGMEDACCYAVAAREEKRAKDFAEKYGIKKYYGSYQELAADPDVELIYVATPHSHHYEHAKLCLEHGKPVLCEKAFTANASQAEEVLKLAHEKEVFITEAIWTRYMPSRQMISDIIKEGKIGEVVSLTANLGYPVSHVPRLREPSLAGGALLDVGVYPLNFASMVMGNAVEDVISSCIKSEKGVDEQNVIILKYPGKKMALLHSQMITATEQYGIIYGTKGYLIAENINNIDKIKIYSQDRKLQEEYTMPGQITGYEYEVRSAIKAIRAGKLECPEMPHEETMVMMRLYDRIRKQWDMDYPFEADRG